MAQKRREASFEERMTQLETQRTGLVRKKASLEQKLGQLEERIESRAKGE